MSNTNTTEDFIPANTQQTTHVSLRTPIRLMGVSYVFMMTWYFIIAGLPLTLLAKMLNMSEFGFGLLGGLLIYGQITQLLGSYIVERYGHRKLIVILGGIVHRSIWLPVAMLPLFTGGSWRWEILLIFACISYMGQALIAPGSVSWIADLVPGRLQGRFFARRMQFGLFASMAVLVLVGYILDKAQAAGTTALKASLITIFIFGSVAGAVEYVLYMFVPDPSPKKASTSTVSMWKILWKPLSDKEFLCYLGVYCTLTSGTAFMGQFIFLFLLDVLKISNVQLTICAVLIPNTLNAICYPFWGKITDKAGYKPALVIGTLGYLFTTCWYIMATPAHWVLPFIFGMIAFCFSSALDTGTAVLMYTKISGQGKSDVGSSYPAVCGVIMAITGLVSALLAGVVAALIGKDWHSSAIGHPLTYHSIIFIIAIAMRLAAIIPLFGLKNLKHYSAADTLRLIYEEIKHTVCRVI